MEAVHRGGHGIEMHVVFACRECSNEHVVMKTTVVAHLDLSVRLGQGAETAVLAEMTVFSDNSFVSGLEPFADGAATINDGLGTNG